MFTVERERYVCAAVDASASCRRSCAMGYVTSNCSSCAVGFRRSGALLSPSGPRACAYDTSSGALAYISLSFNSLNLVAGTPGSSVRAAFLSSLIVDLSAALGVPASRVSVSSLDTDTSVALVALLPGVPVSAPPSVASLVSQLDLLIRTPGSQLYAGSVTSNVDAGTVLAPSFAIAPGPWTAVRTAVSLSPSLSLLWSADASGVTLEVGRGVLCGRSYWAECA